MPPVTDASTIDLPAQGFLAAVQALLRTNERVLEELHAVKIASARHLDRLNEQENVIAALKEQIDELWAELRGV